MKQIRMCGIKQHVQIDSMKEMPNLFCGKVAVGGNYNSTYDKMAISISYTLDKAYDFMVVDVHSENIVYSNTEFGVEPLELSGLINRNMIKTRNEKPYK